jgi:twitching motility protein PilT
MSTGMVIGSNSKSTIMDVFRTGVREVIRKSGLPEEVSFTTNGCEISTRSKDLGQRVDSCLINFKVKEGVDPAQMRAALESARIPHQLELSNGSCQLRLPSFEWKQIPQLLAVDQLIEANAIRSMRSMSWHVSVKQYRRIEFNINVMIEEMLVKKASDIHMRAGSPPYLRIDGDLIPIDLPPLSADDMREVVFQLGGEQQVNILDTEREGSFQYHLAGIGYLRCSGFVKMGAMALAVRFIPEEPVAFDKLDLPESVKQVANAHRGLFLVCGVTGSGKSTTLASLVDYINDTRHSHIITVEDPIEFVYSDKKSIISQRQVGRDTHSFQNALRGALREDPDVILVGEMRDRETIRTALSAASTGHLVFSTLHTMTAVDTINRVISYFPPDERDVIRQELAYSIKGICCQRLLKRKGGGRIPCVELFLNNLPMVKDAILEGEIQRLHNMIEVDSEMRNFDQYAVELFKRGVVERDVAITACSDEEGFNRVVSGIKGTEGRKLLK